jgi:hypothetical protein
VPGQALPVFVAAAHQQVERAGLLVALRRHGAILASRRVPLLQHVQAGVDALHQNVLHLHAAVEGGTGNVQREPG